MEGAEINNWTIEQKLGEGGMSEVWLARHKKLGTPAAIKFLHSTLTRDPNFRERFLKEARTQAQLHHPNIAQVMDFHDQNDRFLIIIEYLPGGSLADVIEKTRGPVETGRAVSWVRQSLEALDFAHQRGIIHRDVKPSNIMIDGHGRAKVMDFGIALVLGEQRMTSTGTAIGTPHYMSPEQILRPKEVDHRTDVYSMGIVLYELLTGKIPFDGDTDFIVKTAQVNDAPPPPRTINPQVPESLENIVMKALAKDADYRYVSCGEFARALAAFQENDGSIAFRETVQLPRESREANIAETEFLGNTPDTGGTQQVVEPPSPSVIASPRQSVETEKLPPKPATGETKKWSLKAKLISLQLAVTFLAAATIPINVELLTVFTFALSIMGILTAWFLRRRSSTVLFGLSAPAFIIVCWFLILVNNWSPTAAATPLTILTWFYLAVCGLAGYLIVKKPEAVGKSKE
jgi:serine/threonine-protein kinase